MGNLLSPVANLLFLAGVGNVAVNAVTGHPWRFAEFIPIWLSRLCLVTYVFAMFQIAMRAWCSSCIYGWRFAAAVPVRVTWGNVVNFVATVAAVRQFIAASIQRRAMAWRKTDHVYPRPRIGEVLVRMRSLPLSDVETAVRDLPGGLRLGEYLVQLRRLSEENLYHALSLQSGIPAGPVGSDEVDRLATRTLPAEASRKWKVLPFRVETGRLHVAVTDVPSQELTRELAGLSALEIRYRLVRPAEFARLADAYLPPAA